MSVDKRDQTRAGFINRRCHPQKFQKAVTNTELNEHSTEFDFLKYWSNRCIRYGDMYHDVLTALRPLWGDMKRNKSKWKSFSSRIVSRGPLVENIHGLLDCGRVLNEVHRRFMNVIIIKKVYNYLARHLVVTDLGIQLGMKVSVWDESFSIKYLLNRVYFSKPLVME